MLEMGKDQISNWTKRWRIKPNGTKSVNVNFTNKIEQEMPIYINNTQIPESPCQKENSATGYKIKEDVLPT